MVVSEIPSPEPTTTATGSTLVPVYVGTVSNDLAYSFGVVVFLLAALLVVGFAMVVRGGGS